MFPTSEKHTKELLTMGWYAGYPSISPKRGACGFLFPTCEEKNRKR
jgi:hypothetical protein